jgi:hypothetical protein
LWLPWHPVPRAYSWNAFSRNRGIAAQAIVDSDGHDTQLSEIPDIAGVNGPFGKRGLKPSQNYGQHESQAMSMKGLYQSGKMADSFMTSRPRGRSLRESQRGLKRFSRAVSLPI